MYLCFVYACNFFIGYISWKLYVWDYNIKIVRIILFVFFPELTIKNTITLLQGWVRTVFPRIELDGIMSGKEFAVYVAMEVLIPYCTGKLPQNYTNL